MPKTILIVEDDLTTQSLFHTILRRAGYESIIAGNTQEAIESLQLRVPDAILLDIGLPGESGIELIKHMKAESQLVNVKIIVISAYPDLNKIVKGLDLEACLSKPMTSSNLLATLTRVLEG